MNNILSCLALSIALSGCATVAIPIAAAVGVEIGADNSKKKLSDYEITISHMSCSQLAVEHAKYRKFNANPFLHSGARYAMVQSRMKTKGCRIPETTAKLSLKKKLAGWIS